MFIIALFALINCSHQLKTIESCTNEHSTILTLNNGSKVCCPVKNGVFCENSDYCCPEGIFYFFKQFSQLLAKYSILKDLNAM